MKRIIQISVSIILIVILFNWIDFNELRKAIHNARYEYFVIAFILITLDRVLMAYKWRLLLQTKNIDISLYEATKIYYIGNFLGLFMPPTIGTDVVRSYYVSKKGYLTTEVISVIIVERILGFLCLFIAALLGFILLINMTTLSVDARHLFTLLIFLVSMGIIIFLLSFNKKVIHALIDFFVSRKEKRFWKKIAPAALDLIVSYSSHKKYKSTLITFCTLTFLEIFMVVLWSYFVALGLNIEVSLLYFTAFIPIDLVLIRIPISFDGFGINESVFIYFLSRIQIHSVVGFNIGIIVHFITIFGILPGAIFYAFNRSLKEMKSVTEANIEKTLDGTIMKWNKGAERIYGYTAQETIGKNISLIIPQDRLQEREEYLKKLVMGEEMTLLKTKRINKEGKMIDISLSIFPVKDPEGKVTGLLTAERNIDTNKIQFQKKENYLISFFKKKRASLSSEQIITYIFFKRMVFHSRFNNSRSLINVFKKENQLKIDN